MNTKGLNKSVLALLIVSSANGAKATNTTFAVDINNPHNFTPVAPKIQHYSVSVPARYKHETQGYMEGQIFLNITEAQIIPPVLNRIKSEYEGEFYFMSHQKVGKAKAFESLGGIDGKIILDLVNQPNQEHPNLPIIYNMHGCSSTLSFCSPLALQINFYRNGEIILNGFLNGNVEVFNDGQWGQSLSNVAILPISNYK